MKIQMIASTLCGLLAAGVCGAEQDTADEAVRQPGLIAWWTLDGDCRDHSGHGNHGKNRGVILKTGGFDGRGAYIEVPHHESLALGKSDFSVCAWVSTENHVTDVLGDVISKYDPARRKGFTLNLKSSSGGYQSSGDDRHVYFGIDNGKLSDWRDCGRPSKTSNYVSNSLTVFRGKLFAAITDAQDAKDWCHVYRYEGGKKWADCGRVGKGKPTGVMLPPRHAPMSSPNTRSSTLTPTELAII